ncbi:hypothetical protein [Nitrosomonas communis]|uniref:hypothetical protein n=1 Tax=Nitrosomonas communis TaxID=44574 RepID=UPI003D298F7F
MSELTKGLLQSKTIWGALLSLLSSLALMMGWDLGDTDQLAEHIAGLVGGILAIYGRCKADCKIGRKKKLAT